jgi:phage terminase large subunit
MVCRCLASGPRRTLAGRRWRGPGPPVEPTEHGRIVVTDDHGLTRRFIPAKATDNPYLDEAYFRRLDSIPDPKRRAAMRDGDWGQFAGQMFSEYRWDRHTLEPITLVASWQRYNGVDWGFAAPRAVLWAAVDEDGRAWVYREIYEVQVGESDQATKILAADDEDEHVAVRWADDAMWATRGDAKPIAQVYAENGVSLTQAGKGPGSRCRAGNAGTPT